LANATDEEVNEIIKKLQSACPGKKAYKYKMMSTEEESQLNENISLRHQESLKSYDECLGNEFIEGTGEWKDRTTGPWSEEEIKIIMDVEGHNSKNMCHILARRLEGRGACQVRSWITTDVITIDALNSLRRLFFCEAFLSSRRKYRGTSMFMTVSKPLAHLIFLSGVNCYDIGSNRNKKKRLA
jgi:hypothetical protein